MGIVVSYAPTFASLARAIANRVVGNRIIGLKEFCMRTGSLVLGKARRVATQRTIAALAAVWGLIAAPAAQSQDSDLDTWFEVTPFAGWMTGGGFEDPATSADRDIEDDTTFGIFLNLMADVPERQYELLYAKLGSSVEGAVPIDLDVQYLQIGGTVGYPQTEHVIPYFGATVGAARLSPDQAGLDDETKFSFSVGGGVRFPITRHFGVRFDLRAFITLLDDDSDLFCLSDPPNADCTIKAKSDTLIQYTGSLGLSFRF